MPSTRGSLVELPDNHVHLWTGSPPSDPDVLQALRPEAVLSDEEQQRWKRLQRVADRNLFAWSHAMLRNVLSSYYAIELADWTYRIGERGRPEIGDGHDVDGLRFNMSHTPGLVAIIVNRAFDAGVDVEQIGRVADIESVARTTCSTSEQSLLASLDHRPRAEMFARIWTLKESLLKATGQGGYVDLANYSFEPQRSGDVVFTTTDADINPATWKFTTSSEPNNHLLTIACNPHQPTAQPKPAQPTISRFDLPTTAS